MVRFPTPCYSFYHRLLACPIGANHARDGSCANRETAIVYDHHPAKVFVQVFNLQHCLFAGVILCTMLCILHSLCAFHRYSSCHVDSPSSLPCEGRTGSALRLRAGMMPRGKNRMTSISSKHTRTKSRDGRKLGLLAANEVKKTEDGRVGKEGER